MLTIHPSRDGDLVADLLRHTGVGDAPHQADCWLVARAGVEPVGVATWRLLDDVARGELVARVRAHSQAYASRLEGLLDGGPVGYLSQLSVAPEQHGRGIGRALMAARLTAMEQQGARSAVGTCWLHPGRRSYETYLQAGFVAVARVPGWWAGHPCVRCGSSCRCDAGVVAGRLPLKTGGALGGGDAADASNQAADWVAGDGPKISR